MTRPRGYSSCWVVKDPLTFRHYEFSNDEFYLLQQFDGNTSLDQVKERYDRKFAPKSISLQSLSSFLMQAHRSNLVLVDSRRQSQTLLDRAWQTRKRKLLYAPLSVLGMRFTFGDAQPLLQRLKPIGAFLFHPWLFIIWLTTLVAGLVLFVSKAAQTMALVPEMDDFLSGRNLWTLAILWTVVKAAHELGHGLACRRFGGECHEFGVQFIAFFPFAYCNVSDAWMFRSRWQRIVVSAAGMYVELIIATAALYLWLFSHPGFFHDLMFNLVFLCSVNTLLFNGNPLLRFDGYYILSDLWEVPNLHSQAKQALLDPIERWLLPSQREAPRFDGNVLGLRVFGLLAWGYRLFTMAMIAWMIYHVLAEYKLQPLAHLLILVMVLGLMLPTATKLAKIVQNPAARRMVRKPRLIGLITILSAGLIAILNMPWHYSLKVPLVLKPDDASYVYAKVAGTLINAVDAGTRVERGESIAKLRNLDLDARVLEYTGRLQSLELQIQNLEIQVIRRPELSAELNATIAALKQATEQLQSARIEQSHQIITAPKAGTVIPPPQKPYTASEGKLDRWSGSPLQPRNANCHIEAGELLCLIGEPTVNVGMILLSQEDLDLVRLNESVSMRLEHAPDQVLEGTISQIAQRPIGEIPPEFIVGHAVSPDLRERSSTDAGSNFYLARVSLKYQPAEARTRSIGWAKVRIADQTLGARLWRNLQQIFLFSL